MRTPKFPGIRTTADGSEAVVWAESHLSQAAFVYPTPPADRMLERFAGTRAGNGRTLWGESLQLAETECGHSAASACEGFALAGGRVTTFTAGQELLCMSEVLRSSAGKRLAMVFHVGARSLASQAITIHAGHDDILSVTDCGWAILFARNPQEAADLAVISRRAAELAETPFLNVQDGFITTHTLESLRLPEPELMKLFVGAPSRRMRNLFNPQQPLVSGPLENRDSYMKGRIAQRFFCDRVRPSLETAMADYSELTGRRYGLIRSFRMEDAEYAVVGLGSMMESAEAAVDAIRSKGMRAGCISITALRPFPQQELAAALARCRSVAVIERTDTPLAESNPLTLELKAALASAQMGDEARLLRIPEVYSGSAGLGGRPLTPASMIAAFDNIASFGRRRFVLGIKHPDALTVPPEIEVRPPGTFGLRIHSLSGFGSVSAGRLIASIAAEVFNLHAVAESSYGAEERGLPTTTLVAFSPKRFELHTATAVVDLVSAHHTNVLQLGDPITGLRAGGTFLFQTDRPVDEVWASLPLSLRRSLRERHIDLFVLDAMKIAREAAVDSKHMARRMQGVALLGAFLRISPLRTEAVSVDDLFGAVEKTLARFFASAGAAALALDLAIARRAFDEVSLVVPPEQIGDYEVPAGPKRGRGSLAPYEDPELIPPGFCDHVLRNYAQGRDGVIEADLYAARGLMPAGTSIHRSFRNLSTEIPRFNAANCTGCMDCVNLCPDSAIVARVVEPETIEHAPEELHQQFSFTQKYYESFLKRGEPGGLFGLYVDPDRCKGCGECVSVCGGRSALSMAPKSEVNLSAYDRARDFVESLPETSARFLHEKALGDMMLAARAQLYSGGAGSCAGCGPSTAIRLLLGATGFLYGADQVGVVAATGCHTAAGSTYPFNPYQVSWANALKSNAPADAIGIRLKWNSEGFLKRRLWVVGDDESLFGAGFHTLVRLIETGLDIKVFVLDKSSLSPVGALGERLLLYPSLFLAQTTPAHLNHFCKAVMEANENPGPAVVICYSACTTDHGIGDDSAGTQAQLAVDARAFPLFSSDPRKGDRLRERLDLRGNPALRDDWYRNPKTFEAVNFSQYAETERRFSNKQPQEIAALEQLAISNWRRLQELAGLR
jgi:pyruvate-ferredoxin/flavodoxin oxidoreductase